MSKPITLITGTRKGIGRFLVEHYVKQGHQVIGCSRGEADYTLENYAHHQVDVANETQVKQLFSHIANNWESLIM